VPAACLLLFVCVISFFRWLACSFFAGVVFVWDVRPLRLLYLHDDVLLPHASPQVIGGEAVLFGEFADATNVDPQLWPRTGCVAEKLWSPYSQTQTFTATTTTRLTLFRCRLVRRGIASSPTGPGFCGDAI
jgi:hypothetical protein